MIKTQILIHFIKLKYLNQPSLQFLDINGHIESNSQLHKSNKNSSFKLIIIL